MALPTITSLAECSDFSKTVTPYIPQLYELPHHILQSYSNLTALKQLYLTTNPLICAFAFSLALAPVFLVVSELNKNYSQVDRLWSILPTIYNAHFCIYAHAAGLPTTRLDNLAVFSTIWSLRLTFNYWRKGGYMIGSEDYRWEKVREYVPASLFFILNIVFISLIQSVLLFVITTPSYVILLASKLGAETGLTDTIFPRVLLGLVMLTYFADQQQWAFQQAKKSYQITAKVPQGFHQRDLDRGFIVNGLWQYCRHPNFAAEQAIWLVLYQWSCVVSDSLYNWTAIGATSYLILFQASTWLTELLTSRKYPEYLIYQKRVNKFIPKRSSGTMPGDFSDKKAVLINSGVKPPKGEKPAKHPAVRR